MKRVYIDTSAALKLFLDEPESDACADELYRVLKNGGELVASTWLIAELTSVMRRMYRVDEVSGLDTLLCQCRIVETTGEHIRRVSSERWGLRSADALHLACALETKVTHIATYDKELGQAAQENAIVVMSPRAASSQ